LLVVTALYFATCFGVLRFCFRAALNDLLRVAPAGDRIRALVRLPADLERTPAAAIMMPVLRKETEP
ncbi:MAG: hypothetical protein WBD07_04145, partial [Vicinamibacterales bacterium]